MEPKECILAWSICSRKEYFEIANEILSSYNILVTHKIGMESKIAKEEVKKPGTPGGMNTEIVGTVSRTPLSKKFWACLI